MKKPKRILTSLQGKTIQRIEFKNYQKQDSIKIIFTNGTGLLIRPYHKYKPLENISGLILDMWLTYENE